MREYKDNRGTLIQVGDEVAYNYSGEIAVGVIKSISESGKKYYDGFRYFPRIKIERKFPIDFPSPFRPDKKLSVVASSKNLLVLKEKAKNEPL